jgi:NADH:ubiquinone oxidoreductase subunit
VGLFSEIFVWWGGQTMGTRFFTWRNGEKVGEDEFGNIYYKARKGQQRWVVYNGIADPSTIPPGWHGWLHKTTDVSPADEEYGPKEWQKSHKPNMTGTQYAYFPPGSVMTHKDQQKDGSNAAAYEAWSPDN